MQLARDPIPLPPPRPEHSHKGTFGTVIVIGGSQTMIGAPALCARAALRCGAGLVKVACPAEVLPFVLTVEPGATGIALGGEPSDMLALIERADPDRRAVLAVGPGLGQDPRLGELIHLLRAGTRPIVLDADGLNLLARQLTDPSDRVEPKAPLVLTPHPGEYKRLAKTLNIQLDPTDPAERVEAATLLAKRLSAVVLLKGHHTIIAHAGHYAINPSGNAALATAGSGDVLTGAIASLIAQGMDAFNAARLGAYVHGLAADQWASQHGLRGLRAIELADWLPAAFAMLPSR